MSPEQPSSKIGKSVGEKLRAARVAQHLTQSQLAAPDFSVSYISAIERGQIHPSLRALEILAVRLGLTSTQLLPNRIQQDERPGSALAAGEHEEEVMYILLEAHLLILEGQINEALLRLESLGIQRLQRPHQLRLRYLQGLAYYRLNRFQEAEFALTEAEQCIQEVNAAQQYLLILSLQAATYSAMRHTTQAQQAYQRCLDLLNGNEERDPFFTLQFYLSLGQHHIRQDNLATSIEAFNRALEIAPTLASSTDIQATYARLSQHYTMTKEFDLASVHAYKSMQVYTLAFMKQLRSTLYHYLGHALLQHNAELAYHSIEETLQKLAHQPDVLAHVSLLTRKAEWHYQRQHFTEAAQTTQQALDLANKSEDTIILAESFILLGRIKFAQKYYDDGNTHFTTGLDMLERLGCHKELADESVRYAQLLEEIGCEREAFTHFRRAFQSRQKLEK